MNIDTTIMKLQERLEIELDNADPTKKGCFGTVVYDAKDSVCLNCKDYDVCGEESLKNRKTHLEMIEEELAKIDEKYIIEKYASSDEGAVSDLNWVDVVVAFAKAKPKNFNEALSVYFKCLEENDKIDTKRTHKILITNAESLVERVLEGLQDQDYIVWDVQNDNTILWKKK